MDNQIKPAMATSSRGGENQMGNQRSNGAKAMTTKRIADLMTLMDFEIAKREATKYQFVPRLCAHISGCTVEQVDAQIVHVMSENKWEDV